MSALTWTVDEVAAELKCSAWTVRERLRNGDLPGLKFGDDWVIPPDALRDRLYEKALQEADERRNGKNKPDVSPVPSLAKVVDIRPSENAKRPGRKRAPLPVLAGSPTSRNA